MSCHGIVREWLDEHRRVEAAIAYVEEQLDFDDDVENLQTAKRNMFYATLNKIQKRIKENEERLAILKERRDKLKTMIERFVGIR